MAEDWSIAPVDLARARLLAGELGVSPLTGEILARRGFTDPAEAEAFLRPDYLVHSPWLLPGMAEARSRLDRALGRGERIAVYGDYDADGVTATFLLCDALRDLGADVVWRLPNRFTEGYGLSLQAIEELAATGATLLVTVDCGIGAHDAVARARELGLDVIVTDHHEPLGPPPDCICVDPKLDGAPFPHLAGVGVALKVAHALMQERGADKVELPLSLRPYVDVVAVGTVADVVPLVDENRALVAMGIGRLRSNPRPGLAALMEVAGVDPLRLDATSIAFRLAPRLNAAGRLDDASPAVDLLAAADRETALPLAQRLAELNADRQALEATILREALAMVPEPLPPAVVLSSPGWHEGVVGIVAARVVEQVSRPAILLAENDGVAKGSGAASPRSTCLRRSRACSQPLLAYGGHKAACGLRLHAADVPAFRAALQKFAGERLTEADFRRLLRVDAIVAGDELTLPVAEELELFAPHGLGNPAITLLAHGAEVRSCRLTRDRRHLQCDVRVDGVTAPAIRFGFDKIAELQGEVRFDVPLRLTRNQYNGVTSAQVQLKGISPVATAADDLCATPCAAACPSRWSGEKLWELLESGELAGGDAGDGAAAAVGELRRQGRLADRRGRPVASTLAALAGAGGRLLVLVADVARRRPLLTRDLWLPQLGAGCLYLNAACAHERLGEAIGGGEGGGDAAPAIVMASAATAAASPALVAAFDHVAFVDPPLDGGLFAAVLAALGPEADAHFVWGRAEVHFTQQVAATDYDLQAACRRLYRALGGPGERAAAEVEEGVVGGGDGLLAKPAAVAAAWRTLTEAGLVASERGKKGDRRVVVTAVDGKVDLTTTATFSAWHARFTRTRFLQSCLSMRL